MSSGRSSDAGVTRSSSEGGDGGRMRLDDLYRLLVHSTRDYAIFVLDAKGQIASWNPGAERIKGYTADEIIGQPYEVFFTDEDREAGEPQRMLKSAAREGRIETEAWRCRKDGTHFWAHIVLSALYDDGELVGYGKVTGDLTAERKAQQELERRERQLEEAQEIAPPGQLGARS